MLRRRLVAVAFLVVFAGGAAYLPVTLGFTFPKGDRAIARITECHPFGRLV